MPRKAKPTKHSAKELKMKADQALTNRGGGLSGMAQRNDAKLSYCCPICKTAAPSAKSMLAHAQNKHSKFTPPGGNNMAAWESYVETECKAGTPISTGAAAMRANAASDFVRPGTQEFKEKNKKGKK